MSARYSVENWLFPDEMGRRAVGKNRDRGDNRGNQVETGRKGGAMRTKTEVLVAVAVMACASVALPAEDAPYPKEKLDVTSLPSAY